MLTNRLNLPQPFVNAATSNHKPTEGRYSVTRTLGGTCEAVLLRRHGDEIEGDVADAVWAVFGSAVHKILEESKETDTQIKENWLSVPINGKYELSGIFDLYDDETGTVTDYKTCGTIKWLKKEFEDYRMQTLMYCLMLRKLGFKAHRGEIVMILRDWVKSKARYERGYPSCQVQKIEFEFGEDDFIEISKYVDSWFAEVAIQEKLPDEELTPCNEAQRWHKNDKWAVMKRGAKRALKLYDSEEEARVRARMENSKAKGNPYRVEHRKGEDTKCELYCSVARWCPLMREDMV